MRTSPGAFVSSGASLGLVAVLAWSYVPLSGRDVSLYYGFGVLVNPAFAGVLALGVVVALAATANSESAADLGAGVALGFAVTILIVVSAWAIGGRVDVFRAPGWLFPAQRWVLVVLALLILFGAGWHARALGIFSRSR